MHPTDPSPSGLRLPGRKVLIAATSVLALLVAVPVVWTITRGHPAETVVKEFFTALQDKDVEAALALVDQDGRAESPRPEFQAPEALGGGWELSGTDIVSVFGSSATVVAEFSTPDGELSREFRLESGSLDEGPWALRDPFVRITVDGGGPSPGPFEYVQVNGVIADVRDFENELTLFPGVYRFFQDVPGVVDFADAEPMALFGEDPVAIAAPDATAEPEAVAAVQQEVDDRIASCVQSGRPAPRDCPFGLLDGTEVALDEATVDEFTGSDWSVLTQPAIAIAFRPADSTGLFALEPAEPAGVVGLTASGYSGVTEIGFTTTCAFDFSIWSLYLTVEDEDGDEDEAVRFAFDPNSAAGMVPESTCDTEP
jgi:hypothetical protein